jgi:hypothetical protein
MLWTINKIKVVFLLMYTHDVCVCVYAVQQNMKFFMQVTDKCSCVEELVCVCNTKNENHMYGVCASCPGPEMLLVLLRIHLKT